MNYEDELKTIEANADSDFWKPGEGAYQVLILGEGELQSPVTFEDGRTVVQVNFPVQVDGKRYSWSVTKGKTKKSLYSKIIRLAVNNGNVAKGLKFTLLVQGSSKKDRSYTIPEVLMLKNQDKVSIEEVI